MSLRDCLASAVAQGALNARQADELHRYYEARLEARRGTMSEAQAKVSARDEVAEALREDARQAKRQVFLQETARKEIAAFIGNYRDLKGRQNQLDAALSLMIHNGYKGTSSMEGRAQAIVALAHSKISDVMAHFSRSKLSGQYRNSVDLPDLVRALHGEATDNVAAKKMAEAISSVMEDLRLRFNEAGGNIGKLSDFGLPHSHDKARIRNLGAIGRTVLGGKRIDIQLSRQKWKDFIRPLLDAERMVNPNSGAKVGAAGLEDALDYVFDSVVSSDFAHIKPTTQKIGQGKLANQRQESRFLHFKSADDWLKYNEAFGQADPVSTIFNHIKGMASDIAAMERFGPNPDAAVEWIKQSIQHDIGKRQAGLKAGTLPGLSAVEWTGYRLDSLWASLRGRQTVWSAPAKFAADIRNVSSAAMLGSTSVLAATTDPFVSAAARRLAGLPVTLTAQRMVKTFARDTDKAAMARRAVLWDDYLHTMNDQARFVDQMFGHEWSKYLVDRALTFNALKPLTEARKRVEAGAWHETLGGLAAGNTGWAELPALLKKTMQGFGLSEADWNKMRAGVDDMGFLDPATLLQKTGDRDLAERYAEMIIQWSERSVPAGDPRIKSVLTGLVPRGTILGEFAEFASQFMSFGMSFTARQLEAHYVYSMMARSSGGKVARGAYYFAALAVPLTIGAAAYQQIKSLLDGKDPENMDDAAFWTKAFVKGGGGGLFADFVDRAENRFGRSFAATLPGPAAALIGDSFDLTIRTVHSIIGGATGDADKVHDAQLGRTASNFLGRYTPILSSHPATRLWYRRMFIDNLQMMTDPEADASFKAKKRKGNYWWAPGDQGPKRAPDLAAGAGG